jgi:thiosulfate dehydrogenase (quinone) large subunit
VPRHESEPVSSGSDGPSASMWSITGPDGSVAAGWLLMPLRLFLGVTFLFAGLQKLADPQFLQNASPTSIHAQLLGASHSSPIHALIGHLLPIANGLGLVIAVGEVAIGAGVLIGLWMRVAAVAGMALSFGLFLTISFHSSPYFTGSDIVFFFAWTPLALAGAAGAPALDTWLAARRSSPTPAEGGVSRRAVLSGGAVTGIVAAAVVIMGGAAAAVGRAVGGTSDASAAGVTPVLSGPAGSTTTTSTDPGAAGSTTPTTAAPPSGTAIGSATGVAVGGSASFTDPSTGNPSLVIQPSAGAFVAFDAVCPHAGCTVAYQRAAKIIACPCHGSEFNAETGSLVRGPATRGLTPITVSKGPNGDLYVPG